MNKIATLMQRAHEAGACESALEDIAQCTSLRELRRHRSALHWVGWASLYGIIPEQYIDAYNVVKAQAYKDYGVARAQAYKDYDTATEPTWEAYRAAEAPAREVLLDSVQTWIEENVR